MLAKTILINSLLQREFIIDQHDHSYVRIYNVLIIGLFQCFFSSFLFVLFCLLFLFCCCWFFLVLYFSVCVCIFVCLFDDAMYISQISVLFTLFMTNFRMTSATSRTDIANPLPTFQWGSPCSIFNFLYCFLFLFVLLQQLYACPSLGHLITHLIS